MSLKENDYLSPSRRSRDLTSSPFVPGFGVVRFEFLFRVAGYACRGKDTVDGLAVRVDFVKVGRKLRGMDVLHRYAKLPGKEESGKAEKGEEKGRKEREGKIKGREGCIRAYIKPPYSFDGIDKSSSL